MQKKSYFRTNKTRSTIIKYVDALFIVSNYMCSAKLDICKGKGNFIFMDRRFLEDFIVSNYIEKY